MDSEHVAACLESPACRSALGAAAVRVAWERRLGTDDVDGMAAALLRAVYAGDAGWSELEIDPDGAAYHRMVGVLIRTRYVDEAITTVVAGGVRQIVNLGSGFDTRPYRLDLPGETVVYEVDLPSVTRLKEDVLADLRRVPHCRRIGVEADLAAPFVGALTAAGLDPRRPLLWIAEGLFQSLRPDDVRRLLRTVDAVSVPGSTMVATSVSSPPMEAAWLSGGATGPARWDVSALATEDYARGIRPAIAIPPSWRGAAGSLFTAVSLVQQAFGDS